MMRQRAAQRRAVVTRGKIVDGAIGVMAGRGIAGLTHRAVAQEAGVSLAATTYHFATKADILSAASQGLLDGYLAAFDRLEARIGAWGKTGLEDLVVRVTGNALGRERTRSLAWCEIILHCARDPAGRVVAQGWYGALDAIWGRIGARMDPAAGPDQARQAIDLVVGLTFLLHPLALPPDIATAILTGQRDPADDLAALAGDLPAPAASPAGQQVIAATIAVLVDDGAAGVTFRSVAERAGLSRSGPAHHFGSVALLVEAAQLTLFQNAKARYRAALSGSTAGPLTAAALLDLTTAVFTREALDHARENTGYYSAWVGAAQTPALRPAVAAAELDQHRAWCRRLSALGGDGAVALRVQALFVGMLIRALATGADAALLARVRPAFARCLAPLG